MLADPSNPSRVLLFGRDSYLLEIRAMVLRSAGMMVDVALDMDDFKVRVAASVYGVVVCCHTATEDECNEVIGASLRNQLALLKLECLLSPQALIDRVARLISERPPKVDAAKWDLSL
jgi:hypothetical protein